MRLEMNMHYQWSHDYCYEVEFLLWKAACNIRKKTRLMCVCVTNMPKKECSVAECRFYLSSRLKSPYLQTRSALRGRADSHTLNVALPLHDVCTQVQVNFRNGAHPPPSSFSLQFPATMWRNSKTGQILLITPHWMKILTSIQKENRPLDLIFSEGERHEKENVVTAAALITEESKKGWEM